MKTWLLRERFVEELSFFFISWKINILTSVFHFDSLIPKFALWKRQRTSKCQTIKQGNYNYHHIVRGKKVKTPAVVKISFFSLQTRLRTYVNLHSFEMSVTFFEYFFLWSKQKISDFEIALNLPVAKNPFRKNDFWTIYHFRANSYHTSAKVNSIP